MLLAAAHVGTARAAVINTDAAPIGKGLSSQILPLICQGSRAAAKSGDFCKSLVSYPTSLQPMNQIHLTLTTVEHGWFTGLRPEDQALVSYKGSFETISTNGGGSILFKKTAAGWQLIRWYPGYNMDGCLAVSATGRATSLCLRARHEQGMIMTNLTTVQLPAKWDIQNGVNDGIKAILEAEDARGAADTNAICDTLPKTDKAAAVRITKLERDNGPADGAQVSILYYPAPEIQKACSVGDVDLTTRHKAKITITLKGGGVSFNPDLNLAMLW